jgi:Rieske Fe-S protein
MEPISRRTFLKLGQRLLALTGFAALFGPVIAYFYPSDLQEFPSEPVSAGDEAEFQVWDGKPVHYGRYPALVLRLPDGWRAYSAVCTHFACIVKWDPQSQQIACPCHAGYFSPQDGSVLAGPPPEPLLALKVEIKDGQVYVGGEG